eukprot:SAG31_NODE_19199_length_609_cov_1.341176_2_plen_79_part_00
MMEEKNTAGTQILVVDFTTCIIERDSSRRNGERIFICDSDGKSSYPLSIVGTETVVFPPLNSSNTHVIAILSSVKDPG